MPVCCRASCTHMHTLIHTKGQFKVNNLTTGMFFFFLEIMRKPENVTLYVKNYGSLRRSPIRNWQCKYFHSNYFQGLKRKVSVIIYWYLIISNAFHVIRLHSNTIIVPHTIENIKMVAIKMSFVHGDFHLSLYISITRSWKWIWVRQISKGVYCCVEMLEWKGTHQAKNPCWPILMCISCRY